MDEYNITYLPAAFWECGYKKYLEDGNEGFDTGYKMGRQCLPDFIDELKFYDKGVKMMAFFGDAFVLSCSKLIESYESQIYTARYCKCLHDQYIKYKVGFEDLVDSEFENSVLHEKMRQYCFSINAK